MIGDYSITTYGKWPAYREAEFEVVAFPHGLAAYTIDAAGKHLRPLGGMTDPPHWGIWPGNVNVSSFNPDNPDTAIFALMDLLRRAQVALKCKENYANLANLNSRR